MILRLISVIGCVLFLLLWTPAAEGCTVEVHLGSNTNATPAGWMYHALYENKVCGKLVSIQTISEGQNDKYHKLGSRDTIIVIPAEAEHASTIELIYWFHGLTGFKEKTFKKRLGPQYGWLINQHKVPAVLVVVEMPWSRFTRTQWKRQGKVFRKRDQFLNYANEVEHRILQHLATNGIPNFTRVIFGHSAGGSAIASAAKYGGLCKKKPRGIVFSDSTYGSWFQRSWRGCLRSYLKHSQTRVVVLGQSIGAPWKQYSAWARKNTYDRKKIEALMLHFPWTHGLIGNNAMPLFYGKFKNLKYVNLYH